MNSTPPIPPNTVDLLKKLDKDYPAHCIRKGQSLEDAHRYAGKRELIEALLVTFDRQISAEMEKTNVQC
jgi:hypothetical protein